MEFPGYRIRTGRFVDEFIESCRQARIPKAPFTGVKADTGALVQSAFEDEEV
jgi:hypothetical protein